RQLVDRLIDLVGDEEIEAEHVVRRLARAPPVRPHAVLELVALPGLPDREADEQRDEPDQKNGGRLHHDPRYSATAVRQMPCARSTCSTHSRAAPRPPPLELTQCTAARTSGAASAGAAENPARRRTGRSCR